MCKQGCKCCHAQTACTFEKWVPCPTCRRYFVSDPCYQTHLASGVCNVLRACNDCRKVYRTYSKHVCGIVYCKICRDHQPQDHLCFIQPLNPADSSGDEGDEEGSQKKKVHPYIFYDLACMLVEHQHVPNLCILHKVCVECIEKPMAEACSCN